MTAQPPAPDRVFETLNAFQRTEALKAALALDLFTAVDEGTREPAALAARCGASERGVRILCDYLTVLGFLTKAGARYALAPDAAFFLSRKSPAYMGAVAGFLGDPRMTERFAALERAARAGGAPDQQGTTGPDDPVWVQFARSMAPMMALPARLIADSLKVSTAPALKVLDVAAGHGLFGVAVAKANPKAEVVAVDWKAVLEVAAENARAAGVGARHHALPGSAFEVDFGTGYDLVLLTNFLHHFDATTNEGLLRKARAALKPGGRVAVLEFVPNPDRVSPPIPASFSLVMLASTPKGDAYTFAELSAMLTAAGFKAPEARPLPPTPQTLVVATA